MTEFVGKQFGRWRVIGTDDRKGFVKCRCACGTVRSVDRASIVHGRSKSCGCYRRDVTKGIAAIHNKTHGLSKDRFYSIYHFMIARCESPKVNGFKNYGGRGIRVCESWRSDFINFKNDMYKSYLEHVRFHGEKDTTLERIDTSGNYEKENCKWATVLEQHNNTRRNRYVCYGGEKISLADLCRKLNLKYSVIRSRIRRGWEIEEAVQGRRTI